MTACILSCKQSISLLRHSWCLIDTFLPPPLLLIFKQVSTAGNGLLAVARWPCQQSAALNTSPEICIAFVLLLWMSTNSPNLKMQKTNIYLNSLWRRTNSLEESSPGPSLASFILHTPHPPTHPPSFCLAFTLILSIAFFPLYFDVSLGTWGKKATAKQNTTNKNEQTLRRLQFVFAWTGSANKHGECGKRREEI